jgi:hypothetical protein
MEYTDVNKLVEKWEPILKEGSELKNSYVEKSTALMLENQFKYLQEMSGGRLDEGNTWGGDGAAQIGYTQSTGGTGIHGNDADFYKIAIPMVRRTFPELIAHDLVGVQPMNAPVGLAFALRYHADQNNPGGYQDHQEVGYNTIDPSYSGTGTSAAPSAMTREDGEALGSADVPGPAGGDTGAYEGDTDGYDGISGGLGVGTGRAIRELSMTIEKAQVEARTRKLRSRWSIEIAQDLKYMHGLNIEEEMLDVLSYEITQEIDRELIGVIRAVAANNPESQLIGGTPVNYAGLDGRWEAEKYRNLYNLMIRKANTLAVSTRRGAANWVVGNPTMVAALEALPDFTIAPSPSDVSTAQHGVAKVGSLGGRLAVYRDTFWTATDQLLMGFKGASAYDTGIVYLPYIQLLVSKAQFEDSFNPVVGLMSRYAIHHHMFGAENYYLSLEIDGMNSQATHIGA